MSEHGQIGHNGVSGAQLKSIVERIERLEEEKKGIQEDIGEVYAEAKNNGFDKAIIREIVKLRKMSKEEREEKAALLDLYMHALGMLADTDLGRAAARSEFGQSDIEEHIEAAEGAQADGGDRAGA